MERYGDEEQRSRTSRPAATRRDAGPCGSGLRYASSTTALRKVAVVGVPCPEPQITASRPRELFG